MSEDAEEQQGTVVSEAVALEEQAMNEINVLEKDAYPESMSLYKTTIIIWRKAIWKGWRR